jgi:hypothetical protein
MTSRSRLLAAAALVTGTAVLAGCHSKGELVVDESVGITAVRGACPAVGIPDYTGDVTLFRNAGDKTEDNIDVVAAMTNVKMQCNDGTGDKKTPASSKVFASTTFDVLARRTDVHGARQVTLPYFVTVLRGAGAVVSKRVGTITLNFADGQERAQASGQGAAYIDRADATLAPEIRERIMRKRKAGEADAAVDPLSEPDVKAAVQRASFEVLLGFQLDQNQLAYNATR